MARAGHHADPRGQHKVAERHAGEPEGIVEQVEREGGRQPGQEDDLPALARHRLVDGAEPRVGLDATGHPVAGQVAPHQERRGGAEGRGDRDEDEPPDHPEDGAGPEGEDPAGQEENRGQHVQRHEDRRTPGAETGNPVQRPPEQGRRVRVAGQGEERHERRAPEDEPDRGDWPTPASPVDPAPGRIACARSHRVPPSLRHRRSPDWPWPVTGPGSARRCERPPVRMGAAAERTSRSTGPPALHPLPAGRQLVSAFRRAAAEPARSPARRRAPPHHRGRAEPEGPRGVVEERVGDRRHEQRQQERQGLAADDHDGDGAALLGARGRCPGPAAACPPPARASSSGSGRRRSRLRLDDRLRRAPCPAARRWFMWSIWRIEFFLTTPKSTRMPSAE